MSVFTEHVASWIDPDKARAILEIYNASIGGNVLIPIGTRDVRLSLVLERGPEDPPVLASTDESSKALARLLESRVGKPVLGTKPEETEELDAVAGVVCGECGTPNHSKSLLCRKCANRLIEKIDPSKVPSHEVLVIMQLLVCRTAAEGSHPERAAEMVLERLKDVGPHQLLFQDLSAHLAAAGDYRSAACWLWLARACEPWRTLSRPGSMSSAVRKMLAVAENRVAADAADSSFVEPAEIDEVRTQLAVGTLKRIMSSK